jgi:ABC-type uncharacterized transport system permease subunit
MHAMDSWFLAGISFFALSTCLYLASLNRHQGKLTAWAKRSLDLALVFWFALLICWSVRFASIAPSRLLLGGAAGSLTLLYRLSLRRYQWHNIGSVVTATSTVLATFSFILSRPLQLNVDANQWLLIIHISLAMIGLIAFSISAIISGLYLITSQRLKHKKHAMMAQSSSLPSLNVLDQICLKSLLIGFPFYTLALLLGSVQAFQSHTKIHMSYVIAIISWFIFGIVLQARLTAGWRGQKAAWLTLIAALGVFMVVASYTLRAN